MKSLIKKENILPLTISVAITVLFFAGYHYLGSRFNSALWIINGILLAALLSMIMSMAGFVVLKALFVVAAELSLLIFLAQSYCGGHQRTTAGDQALKSLVVFGLLYIGYAFVRAFVKILKEKYTPMAREHWSQEKIIFITLFLIFTISFIWQICLVIQPVVSDLCVFK